MFATTNAIAKIAAVVAGLGLVAMSFAFAPSAKAATTDELQAQITLLLAQIAALQGGSSTSASVTFTMDLTLGSTGAEVTALQNWLIAKGYSIPAGGTGYFGAQTQAALAAYQAANGISPAAGYFGPITRAKVNAAGGSTGSTGGNTSTGGLQGGAGSIESFDEISGLTNEHVGEDEEDVEIAGLEVEVDDGSDIELTAVRLDFSTQPGNDKLEDFVTEVSIWCDGEEFARIDADSFDDNNDWTKTVSLDDGCVIEAGETADLTVAVTGVNNIDTGDAGDDWALDFVSIRFVDADGATVTEDTNTDAFTWDVETFADATNAELKISLTDGDDADDINDAHVINVDDNDETTDTEILAFTAEVDGDSDLMVDEVVTEFAVTGAAGLENMASTAYLYMDGDLVGEENIPADETVTFDNLDLELSAGDEYEFVVKVDLLEGLTDGWTIQGMVTDTETDLWDVEDESGENLADADKTGSATGDAHGVYDSGIMVAFVSASDTVIAGEATIPDQGQFKIIFDVTAFDADAYVDASAITDEAGGATYQNIVVNGAVGTASLTSNATSAANSTYRVREDQTERFTLTVNAVGEDAFADAALESVLYAATAIDGDTLYSFNMSDYKTDSVYLRSN